MVLRSWTASFDLAVLGSGGQGEADGIPVGVGCEMPDVWDVPMGVGSRSSRVRGGCGPVLGLFREGLSFRGRPSTVRVPCGPGAHSCGEATSEVRSEGVMSHV